MKYPGILAAGAALSLCAVPSFAAWPELGGLGVTVCDPDGNPHMPASAGDESGGAYFAWLDDRDGFEARRIFAQHVSGSGVALWPANGISVGSTMAATLRGTDGPMIVSDAAGGAIVLWREFLGDTAGNLRAQRLTPGGELQWGTSGVPVSLGARHEVFFVAAGDGAGGMFVAWRDDRDSIFTIRAQRVDDDGNLLWGADGVVVCANHGSQESPRISVDGMGGAFVVWTEFRDGALRGFAQRLNAYGELQWNPLGVLLSTSLLGTYVNDIDADGTGGMVATWQDYRSQNTWAQTFAQRVAADGNVLWAPDGESLSGTAHLVSETFVQGSGDGGAIIGWHDFRNNGTYGITAQRLSPTGEKQWAPTGVVVATPPNAGGWDRVKMLPDGADGVVFAWNAEHGIGDFSVYAQRVSSAGSKMWSPAVELASLVGVVWQTVAVPDGSGGLVAGWIEANGFNNIARHGAQRVTGEGTLGVGPVAPDSRNLICVPNPVRVGQGVEVRLSPTLGGVFELVVCDLSGRSVRTIGAKSATGAFRWDGRGQDGQLSPPGVYFLKVVGTLGTGKTSVAVVR